MANLGRIDYLSAWELQKDLVRQVSRNERPPVLLLLEHPRVYTVGRRGDRSQVRLDTAGLERLSVALYETDRGGQVTYHGPGQLVAYPIINLRAWGGPLKYVRVLEQVMVRTLADYGITAGLVDGLTGVWVENAKVGAIGVKISGGVAHHGLSLNVAPCLDYYRHIVPCGIEDREVTSMAKLLERTPDQEMVEYSLQYHFGKLMELQMVEVEAKYLAEPQAITPTNR